MAAANFLLGAGAFLNAYGAYREGEDEFLAGSMNADQYEKAAKLQRFQTQEEERRFRVQSKRVIGDIRTNYGASGVQLAGSALDVLKSSVASAELDALTLKYSGEMKALNYEKMVSLARDKADRARQNAGLNMLSGLLGFGAKATSMNAGGGKGGLDAEN